MATNAPKTFADWLLSPEAGGVYGQFDPNAPDPKWEEVRTFPEPTAEDIAEILRRLAEYRAEEIRAALRPEAPLLAVDVPKGGT